MGASFTCEVVDARGRRARRVEQAATAEAARQSLEAEHLVVLEVTPASGGAARTPGSGRAVGRDVLELTRATAGLLGAGLPLARALGAATTLLSPAGDALADELRYRVERGTPLANALAEHPRLFSGLYVGLIRAGERSGDLAAAFRRLAAHLETEAALRARLISASIYPLLLASAGGIAVLVLLFAVLPRFAEILAQSGAELPRSTALLLDRSLALRRWWPPLLSLPGIATLLLMWTRITPEGRRAAAHLLVRLPVVGPLCRNAVAARAARLLGALLGGGAPVLSALEGAAESIAHPLGADALASARARVREGAALHRALSETGAFPTVMVQLAALGEETGRLAEFLGKAAELLEAQVERAVQRLVALAEPVMIIVFGGLVGFVALSLLQAIYSVNAGSFR